MRPVASGTISYFNPRSSCEERRLPPTTSRASCQFQSTLLMRGATPKSVAQARRVRYFNPRSSCEERLAIPGNYLFIRHFNPRSSCEERRDSFQFVVKKKYFNPRSSCEERPRCRGGRRRLQRISIHAPHARSDYCNPAPHILGDDFNPRSSCEERRASPPTTSRIWDFNPRSSCEERRASAGPDRRRCNDFNPRSSCEERQFELTMALPTLLISIHAPHARSDSVTRFDFATTARFQSTLLMRGATIHRSSGSRTVSYFNPRSSCEERPLPDDRHADYSYFNPRSSCEERHLYHLRPAVRIGFQSTLLMRGATASITTELYCRSKFQSTLLMRGATYTTVQTVWAEFLFQSTLLMRGATHDI